LPLVGCGDTAANDMCLQLQEYEQRAIEADYHEATADFVNETCALHRIYRCRANYA